MIVTELYEGQGLGNQLACYIATRVIAKDKGYGFGIQHPERFKGLGFLTVDFGQKVLGGKGPAGGPPEKLPDGISQYYVERKVTHPENGSDIRDYDKHLVDILDNTKIDGLMQGEQYIAHHKEEIRSWLTVKKEFDCFDYADENTCVINFRGGEYARHPEFFLQRSYWQNAVAKLLEINKNFRFIVITDDVLTAKNFFPDYGVFHFSIGKDYSIIKNAHYLILSNSTFAWFPAWLNKDLKFCIAPKYWARHNISDGYWSLGCNLTKDWHYLDRDGKFSDYDTCRKEWISYMEQHAKLFAEPKIQKNFLVVSNYNNDLRWVPEYSNNYVIYDHKSDKLAIPDTVDPAKVIKAPNLGYNSYNYFTFIIDNYDNLPDVTIFAKGWSFPRHVRKEYFDRVMNNECFTPLEDWKMHHPRFPVAFFAADGGYCEINNSWYLRHWKTKYFTNYNDFLRYMYKDPVIPRYVRFAPGGDYIVPKANILKLPKVAYQNMRLFMAHCQEPGETHLIERAVHTLWTSNFELNPTALKLIDETFALPKKDFKARLKEKMPTSVKNVLKSMVNVVKNAVTSLRQPFDVLKEKVQKKNWLSSTALAAYRKSIKVYDTFVFFNELDLLEIRLNILNDHVDYFVLVESNKTFTGKDKPLVYEMNKHRFAQFNDKIIHIVVEDMPDSFMELEQRLSHANDIDASIIRDCLTTDNIPREEIQWLREFYQKEQIRKGLLKAADNDICYISDVDEIWNPDAVIDYSKDDIFKYRQDPYVYFLNNRSNEDWRGWVGTIATKYQNIKKSNINHIRTWQKNMFTVVRNGGWHFTFQGGVDKVKAKLEAYGHQELNNEEVKSSLDDTIKNNKDIRGRYIKFWTDESNLPTYILKHRDTYKELFK
jgi:hypothetical protein